MKDGESLAIFHLSKALDRLGCSVSMLAMNTTKHPYRESTFPEAFAHYENIYTVPVDNQIKWLPALVNLFSSNSYHISRYISSDFESKLIQVLENQEFDWIQLETLYLAPYIPVIRKYSKARVVMRAHNVEHEIWERVVQHMRWPSPKRWYLRHLTKKLKTYEVGQLNKYDLLLPITQRDGHRFKALGHKGNSLVLPIGLDLGDYSPDPSSCHRPVSMAFIGSMDWVPNLEGIEWFLKKVWGPLSRRFPNLKLHIAGRNTPEWLQNLNTANIHVHGEVPDAPAFLNEHSVLLVPLLSGSGMRAKILEGMALGKVVLTTTMGLEGIEAKDRKEVLVADTPQEFIQALDYCFQNNGALEEMGQRALQLIGNEYDNQKVARKLVEACEKMVASPNHTFS